MKLVDELYELYKDQLTGDEHDAILIVSSILGELEREHLLEWMESMTWMELYEMLGSFLVEKLRTKIHEEGVDDQGGEFPYDGGVIH